MAFPPVPDKPVGGGATADATDFIDGVHAFLTATPGEVGADTATYVVFDAGADADAARPAVGSGVTVAWFNVPSEPTNLGAYDIWEDAS